MSLRWDWNQKMGTFKVKRPGQEPATVNIYQGNCLAVCLSEWEEKGKGMYCLYTFFGDEQHIKNIIKSDPHFFDEWKNVRLNLYYEGCKKLLKYLVNAGLRVTVYSKAPRIKKEPKLKITVNNQ